MIEPAKEVEFWSRNGSYDNVLLCQIFGGMGLMEELPLEMMWRDARIERWDRAELGEVSAQRVGQDESVPAVILGAGHVVTVPEPVPDLATMPESALLDLQAVVEEVILQVRTRFYDVLLAREQTLSAWRAMRPGEDLLECRDLEILAQMPVSVDQPFTTGIIRSTNAWCFLSVVF